MSNPAFLTTENLNLIWDVLMENKLYLNKPKDFFVKINTVFNENIHGFYQQEKKFHLERNIPITLLDLNKKFISLFHQHIQQMILPNYLSSNTNSQTSSLNPETKNILREEILNDRISKFENNFNIAKQDFTNAMTIPIPSTPEFKDKLDIPISDLELEIKKTIAQRNYDIEMYPPNRNRLDETWLKAQETSIKKEKLNITKSNNSENSQPLRYIKIEETNLDNNLLKKEIIELPTSLETIHFKKEKHISWAQKENQNIDLEQENTDLFKKFKVIEPKERMELLEKRISKIEANVETLLNLFQQKI